ncbi:membrane protein [Corynebacterium aquilae DSM 44791]|uniref:Membrane protein n=1 Tax=Corynebacterium aquilae DSM 44791 TaxID=1431546 RepID=A0A1L7CIN3_9CORY|nr:membrane protein [Corynebacterium aquilae DSM 44791]
MEFPEYLRREIDFVDDPLARLERNENSTKSAIAYCVAIPVLTIIVAFGIALSSRAVGGPICDAGVSTWLCSRRFEILFPVVPGLVAFGGLLGAGWMTYRTWSKGVRWRPWLASMWWLLPFTLLWMTSTGTIAILGQR